MSQRFISESDIEANKKQLQEAWNATRGENDPENRPDEPPPDHRTLFHRLEEQKLKKQEDYEDAHRLKNMIRGLEDEEVQFLDLVDRSKMEQERRVRDEETTALSEFRKRRVEMEIARSSEIVSTVSQSNSISSASKTPRNSQKLLLSGAVKRKVDTTEQSSETNKRTRTSSDNDGEPPPPSSGENGEQAVTSNSMTTDVSSESELKGDVCSGSSSAPEKKEEDEDVNRPVLGATGYLQCVGVLPGLGQYSDSSNSGDTTDESDPDTRPRFVVRNRSHKKKNCC